MKKKYHRNSKSWLTPEEFDTRKEEDNKKKNRCEKHDFILVLPLWGCSYDDKYKFNPELYYETMKEIQKFENEKYDFLADHGILVGRRFNSSRDEAKHYQCANCGKQLYK